MNKYQIRERSQNVVMAEFRADDDDANTIFQQFFANGDCLVFEETGEGEKAVEVDVTHDFLYGCGDSFDTVEEISDGIDLDENNLVWTTLETNKGKIVKIWLDNGVVFIGKVISINYASVMLDVDGSGEVAVDLMAIVASKAGEG